MTTSVAAPTGALNGILTVHELMKALLDQTMDGVFRLSMQEEKTHPIHVESYKVLALPSNNHFWVYSRTASATKVWMGSGGDTECPRVLNRCTTVRDLILHLAQYDPKQEIILTGHFYGGLRITAVRRLTTAQQGYTHVNAFDIINI